MSEHIPLLWSYGVHTNHHRTYAEVPKTLPPSPSPILGRWEQEVDLTPLLPFWEKGLGDEGN